MLCNKWEDSELQGIPILMDAYHQQHKDNAEVVESICTLVMELCEYGQYTSLKYHGFSKFYLYFQL